MDALLDAIATEPQYLSHVLPVWLRVARRGVLWVSSEGLADRVRATDPTADVRLLRGGTIASPVLVASHRDHGAARRKGAPRVAIMEHGVGQSYRGDTRTARHPSYAGGDGRDGAEVILAPNALAAALWADRYPRSSVHVIGATRVLNPPEDPGDPLLVVSFHWTGAIPELRGALPWYRDGLAELARKLPVAGHSHPRYASTARVVFERAGIPFLPDLDEVARRATVYAVDNSSTLWELGRTRPAIALNAPWYRRSVIHGLRFWSHVPFAVDGPDELASAAARFLRGGETPAEGLYRRLVVDEVIPFLDGDVRAATILDEWLAGRLGSPRSRGVRREVPVALSREDRVATGVLGG